MDNTIVYDKNIHTNKSNDYNNLINIFNKYYKEYTLLTSYNDYMISDDCRLISYKHECGEISESLYPTIRCLKCYDYDEHTGKEEIVKYCKSLGVKLDIDNTDLDVDIYFPDHNYAIEFDDLLGHSCGSVISENKEYHLNKTNECEKKGIQLLHIFENEWVDKQKQLIWKSIIQNKLGKSNRIFARKTIISKISNTDTLEFLDDNHIQGKCISSINLGLLYNDELVSIMTFGSSRYDKKLDWELIRFCNKKNHTVIGAASKLLKAFKSNYKGSIVSYADRRRSNGNLYKQLKFKLTHSSGPNYFYYKDSMTLESRVSYQKHKLKDKLDPFDAKLTESENMYRNGFRKIYDCGNQVWLLSDDRNKNMSDFYS